jgi:hypothetical protein
VAGIALFSLLHLSVFALIQQEFLVCRCDYRLYNGVIEPSLGSCRRVHQGAIIFLPASIYLCITFNVDLASNGQIIFSN